jgi:hypothetical protein
MERSGFESRFGQEFFFRHVVQTRSEAYPVYTGDCPWGKTAGAWSWLFTSNQCRGRENADLYIHSPTRLHGVVFNWLSAGTTLPLPVYIWLYSPCGPCPLLQFLNSIHSRYESLDELLALRKAATYTQNNTDIHDSNGTRTHDPSIRSGWDGSCLGPRDHCDR